VTRVLGDIDVRHVGDGRHWLLLTEFGYHLGHEDGPEFVLVPIGFLTDFASIPRAFWPVLPPAGRYAPAALVHDWLYAYPYVYTPTGTRRLTRDEADRVFLEIMTVLGVGWWTRHVMHRAVRLFGAQAFEKRQTDEVEHLVASDAGVDSRRDRRRDTHQAVEEG
jgi:hypothetical protein